MLSEIEPVVVEKQPRQFSLDERKAYVAKWKQSHLTRSEFCRREKLCLQTFCYWVKTYSAQTHTQSRPTLSFIPLGTKKVVDVNSDSNIEIHLPNGLRCCFKNMTEVQTLVKIVEGLLHVTDH